MCVQVHTASLVFCNHRAALSAPIGSLLLQQDTNHVSHFNYGISLYILFKLKERERAEKDRTVSSAVGRRKTPSLPVLGVFAPFLLRKTTTSGFPMYFSKEQLEISFIVSPKRLLPENL